CSRTPPPRSSPASCSTPRSREPGSGCESSAARMPCARPSSGRHCAPPVSAAPDSTGHARLDLARWIPVGRELDADVRALISANEANWDERTPIHVASRFYGVDGSRAPEQWFADFEWTDLGELTGRDVVHLQCHLGTETVVLARRGARVTGLDISEASVREARRLAREARSEEHTSELQSREKLVCRLLREKKKEMTSGR